MMQTDMPLPETSQSSGPLKGYHVLLIMLAFFGVMFAVNGVFLYHAITSFPGEDVKKSYLQGLNYNQTLESRADQAALGWQAEAGVEQSQLVFRLYDQAGAPISGTPVLAELRRLTTDTADQVLTLTPKMRGEYIAELKDFESGQWRVKLSVFGDNTAHPRFVAHKQIEIP